LELEEQTREETGARRDEWLAEHLEAVQSAVKIPREMSHQWDPAG
jgi:hypothetical protein